MCAMHDLAFFKQHVRSQLPPLRRVSPEREAAIIEELAQQMSSAYEDALRSGATDSAALQAAQEQFRDWPALAASIQDAERVAPPPPVPQDGQSWAGLWQDIRFGVRLLQKSPGFAASCVLTLALGIGGCAAMFSLLDAIVLRPLDYREPEQLMVVWEHNFTRDRRENVVSPANYLDWRSRTNLFSSASAVSGMRATITGFGEPEEVDVQIVQHEYFSVFGVNPIQGRLITAEEDKPDVPRPVILGFSFWMRKFNGDGSIVGKAITLGGRPYNVIGILPANFLALGKPADIYTAMQLNPSINYRRNSGRYLRVIARLRPGVTRNQAQRDLSALALQLEQEFPEFNKNWGVNVVPLQDQFSAEVRLALWILMGAVGMVLLIACANVANLLLARSVQREREVAVRASLGATRFRMVRQMLTESLVLAFAGATGGCVLAWGIVRAFQRFGPVAVPRLDTAGLDLRVLLVTVAIAVGTAIVSGLAPAILSTRTDLTGALKEGGRGIAGGRHNVLRIIVVAEVALAVILLSGAGLLLRSFQQLLSVHPGFDAKNVLTVPIGLSNTRYRSDEAMTSYFRSLNERVRQLPGVVAASSITFLPFSGLASATSFRVANRPEPAPGQSPTTEVRIIQPRYFEAMRIPIRQGRDFTDADAAEGAPLRFIVNETLAKTMFPGENPLGQQLIVSMQRENKPSEIIGVVADTKHYGLQVPVRPMVYYPQGKLTFSFATLVIRTQQDPLQLAQPVLRLIRAIDPEQAVSEIRTMENWLERSVATQRFIIVLLTSFAVLAVLLAVIGIYSVLSFAVSQRTHEIGIRMALGALHGEVRWWIVRHGLVLACVGLVIGLAGALVTNGLLKTFVFEVELRDPLTLAGAALLLGSAALAASYIPALRATRVDPMEALRYE
jgi:putative ABC transport system permease protein